jgi:hypothetical protein
MTTGIPRDAKIACIKIRDMSGVVWCVGCGLWVGRVGDEARDTR